MHEGLRKVRKALVSPYSTNSLFTYLEEDIVDGGAIPATSSKIENLNGQIRGMLSPHHNMNINHRIEMVFWFCHMKSKAQSHVQ